MKRLLMTKHKHYMLYVRDAGTQSKNSPKYPSDISTPEPGRNIFDLLSYSILPFQHDVDTNNLNLQTPCEQSSRDIYGFSITTSIATINHTLIFNLTTALT